MSAVDVKSIVVEAVREMESTRKALIRECMAEATRQQYDDVCKAHFQAGMDERRELRDSVIAIGHDVTRLLSDTGRIIREMDDANGDGVLSQVKILVERDCVRAEREHEQMALVRRIIAVVAAGTVLSIGAWVWGLLS